MTKRFEFQETAFHGVRVVMPTVLKDARGSFMRLFCAEELAELGFSMSLAQANISRTLRAGSIRGLHFQLPPAQEVKLVCCLEGAVFDVIVDLRKASPTYSHWVGLELSTANYKMVLIPEGCAHGFQTLTDNVTLLYFHSQSYNPQLERGIRFNDSSLNISWPMPVTEVSERDKGLPPMSQFLQESS